MQVGFLLSGEVLVLGELLVEGRQISGGLRVGELPLIPSHF